MIKNFILKMAALVGSMLFGGSQIASAQNMYKPITGEGVQVAKVLNSGIFCVTQLCCGESWYDLQNIIDEDVRTASTHGSLADVLNTNGVSVKNYDTVYPAGYVAGYLFSSESLVNIGILNNIYVSTYLNGCLQEVKSAGSLLTANIISVDHSKNYLTFVTTKAFDEVRFHTSGLTTSFLNGIKIFSAFAFPSTGQPFADVENCNLPINGHHVNVSYDGPGICAGCNLINGSNINDADADNYASLITPASIISSPTVGVLNTAAVYPAGYKAGFVISNSDGNALGLASFLNTMTIETYLFGKLQESSTTTSTTGGGLLSMKLFAKNNSNRARVEFTTCKPFNEIRFKQNHGATVSLSSTRIYYAYAEPGDCIDCKVYLGASTSGEFSGSLVPNTYGFFGIGSETFNGTFGFALHSLSNINSVVTANTNDYATYSGPLFVSIGAGARVTAKNNGTSFPAGTSAGFDIIQTGGLFDISLLSKITIKTYLISGSSKILRECKIGNGHLLGLDILPGGSSKASVGFKTTKSFNAVQIELNSGLVQIGLGNTTRIYGAYIFKDADGDGYGDCIDFCPGDNSIDTDFDGVPDACDNCNVGSVPPNFGFTEIANDCGGTNPDAVELPLTSIGGNYINTVIEYHTSSTPSASTKLPSNVISSSQEVYAVFRDTIYNCYSEVLKIDVSVNPCELPDLKPVILYGQSEYGPNYKRIGASINNLNNAATTTPITFEVKGLPLEYELVDIQVNIAGQGTSTIHTSTINYDNTVWDISNISEWVGENNNAFRFVSKPSFVIPAYGTANVVLTFKTHNNNPNQDVMMEVVIANGSGGEVVYDNNRDFLSLVANPALQGDLITKTISVNDIAVKLHPNPTKDQVVLTGLTANSTIEVFNALGQLVGTYQNEYMTKIIDMRALPAGSYIIKVTNISEETPVSLKVQKI